MFKLNRQFSPQGDQQQAISKLLKSLQAGNRHQTLLGVTGSGKTFSMANIIAERNQPTLVISHNKTLAAQLYSEFKNFFPENAVEYFVSYFDYYQPEAYIPRTDTYIEKDSAVNDEIERLRLSAMGSLLSRKDLIIVASVSCIYGLGSPEDYANAMLPLVVGQQMERDELLAGLIELMFERNDMELKRGCFRVRADIVDVFPATSDELAIRIEFFDEQIESIAVLSPISGRVVEQLERYIILPAKQFVTSPQKRSHALAEIRKELEARVQELEAQGKLVEAQRIRMRTEYDMEMIAEMGFCQGIENYSRHLTGRPPGAKPYTLLDFFNHDFLTIIDESHVSLPQFRGMYMGDMARKRNLVEHGFRLPSALDNRPLKFAEFMSSTHQLLYVSATPSPFEILNSRSDNRDWIDPLQLMQQNPQLNLKRLTYQSSNSTQAVEDFDPQKLGTSLIVEQIIRPTGLLEPEITLQPLKGQIDRTIELCHQAVKQHERVLVSTLTKKTAEDLCTYLQKIELKVAYIHSDIDSIERVEILRQLRAKQVDILIGINLLREGLDLPEVALVCILDADKEGFLRNQTSLIQTAGRAARHVNGRCVLFCDTITDSIKNFLQITNYRRELQMEHNKKHHITPRSAARAAQQSLQIDAQDPLAEKSQPAANTAAADDRQQLRAQIGELESAMHKAAARLEFEKAAHLRDQLTQLKQRLASEL